MMPAKTRDVVPYQQALLFCNEDRTLTTSCRPDRMGGWSTLKPLNDYLGQMAETYAPILHSAFVLYTKGTGRKQIKQKLSAKYKVKARVINSAMNQAKTALDSMAEVKKSQKQALENKIHAYEEKITKEEENRRQWHSTVKWHKPKPGDVNRNRTWKAKIHNMKDRLHHMKMRLENWDTRKNRFCFGSRKLFNAQYHLHENGLKDHSEWKALWHKERTRLFYQIGSTDETCGNQICQFYPTGEPEWFEMKLRSGYSDDKTLYEHAVHVPYLYEELKEGILHGSVSYRFVKTEKGWYIQPAITIKQQKEPEYLNGMAGIDINDDFISVCWANRKREYLEFEDIPYPNNLSSKKNESKLKEILARVFQRARRKKYGVAIESISLTRKKTKIQKQWEKQYNHMLSRFPYTRYMDSCESISIRKEVPLYYVSPYWSSVLGDQHKEEFGISRHQGAAYIIASRALGYEEFYVKEKKNEVKEE